MASDEHATEHASAAPTEHVAMSPAARDSMFSCRQQCWSATPFDSCRDQRDTCIANASANGTTKGQCRQMSRACRKIRRDCLEACTAAAKTK